MEPLGTKPVIISAPHQGILDDPSGLRTHIISSLQNNILDKKIFPSGAARGPESSAVLFTLGMCRTGTSGTTEICLILNKRSARVKQPGDLCFPGGGIAPRIDQLISKIITLPMMPLGKWPHWEQLLRERKNQARRLSLLLATGIREGLEEMGLNPLRMHFLGPLPSQDLVMYRRTIYPMATWIVDQRRFRPNWEVEKLVHVPLKDLLVPDFYRRCSLVIRGLPADFPCFLYQGADGEEILWGATYKMVTEFIRIVFRYEPPFIEELPVLERSLSREYLKIRRA
jgi:8-oxo-dGTP pyrophosphatase MutT (NUDIX family)